MTSTNLDSCVQNYEDILSGLLNKHVPARTRSVRVRPHSHWFNVAIQTARKLRRVHERKRRHIRLEIDRQLYCNQRKKVNELINVAKIEYYSSQITDCSGDQKKLFKVVNGLLHQAKKTPVLPSSVSDAVLADSFSRYFSNKILNIRSIFPVSTSSTMSQTNHFPVCAQVSNISQFASATVFEVKKLIRSSPSKSCELDPIPTDLLKKCIDVAAPLITTIVNKSFEQGSFPDSLKTAYIRPLIKKPGLDVETLSNYRPVSNLKFIGKTIERIVASRLNTVISDSGLADKFQSAYRCKHSTESALLRMQNGILCAMDNGHETALILLDFSAAFDTVDHTVLLKRLRYIIGLQGYALKWCQSYCCKTDHNMFALAIPHRSLRGQFLDRCGLQFTPTQFIASS